MKKLYEETMHNYIKRLVCFGMISLITLFLSFVFPPFIIICLLSFSNFLSLENSVKTEYVESLSVQCPNGTYIPCVVLKEKDYAFMPLVPLFNIHFYIPYRVRYHVIKYASAPALSPGTKFADFINSVPGLCSSKELTKKEYLSYKSDLQKLAGIFEKESYNDRVAFLNTVKPFIESGIVREDIAGDFFSVCSIINMEQEKLFFQYSGKQGIQTGSFISAEKALKIRNDRFAALTVLFDQEKQDGGYIDLNNKTLENLILTVKSFDQSRQDISDNGGSAAKPDGGLEQTLNKLNNGKQRLTDETIEKKLLSIAKKRSAGGYFFFFLSFYALMGVVAGITTLLIPLAIICVPLVFLTIRSGANKIKKAKRLKKAINDHNYRLIFFVIKSKNKKNA